MVPSVLLLWFRGLCPQAGKTSLFTAFFLEFLPPFRPSSLFLPWLKLTAAPRISNCRISFPWHICFPSANSTDLCVVVSSRIVSPVSHFSMDAARHLWTKVRLAGPRKQNTYHWYMRPGGHKSWFSANSNVVSFLLYSNLASLHF